MKKLLILTLALCGAPGAQAQRPYRPAGGPVYRSMERDGDRLVLTFDTTGPLRSAHNPRCDDLRGFMVAEEGRMCPVEGHRYSRLHGFAIAGTDRRFVWATAYVLDESRVVVFSDEVSDPVAVRYGWADNPVVDDLTDDSGLLASPFRTDAWEGITR